MNERMTKIQELFHSARNIKEAHARDAFLRRECGDDQDLYDKVVRLVAQSDSSTFFLDRDAVSEDEGQSALPTLGKYQVDEQIGKGGMGVVFAAYDPDLQRKVALKVPSSLGLLGEQGRSRFKAEARAVAALDVHPNIVRIHALELEHEPPFIVMEYLDGTDLAKVVTSNGPLSIEEAAKHIVSAAKGLQKAHENRIVHRDVKPHNVFLTVDGTTKVLDLGLAKLPRSRVRSTTELINEKTDSQGGGSIEFISPEQSSSLANADHRSDIYGLGCTFYYLVTGEVPFPNLDRDETILAHCNASRPSILDKVTADPLTIELDATIQKMIAIRSEDRHESMSAVVNSISETIDTSVRRRKLKRRRLIAGVGIAAAIMLIASVVWSLLPPNYYFDLEKVADANEVSELVKIGDQISAVKKWLTDYSQKSKEVAKLILDSRNAKTFKDCLVAGDYEGLGEINKALLVLARFHSDSIPSDWRRLSLDRLAKRIETSLQEANQRDMIGRVENLVSKPASKLVLDRWGIEAFPSSKYPHRQDRWIAALEQAIEDGVRPTANWYDAIRSAKEIEFGKENASSLIIRQRANETKFQGEQSIASFDVWVRLSSDKSDVDYLEPGTDSALSSEQLVEVETGIRLIEVPLRTDRDDRVAILWPPKGGVVDHGKFENFLQYHGLPGAFKLSREVLQFNPNTEEPALNVKFDVVHEDLPECFASNQVSFDVGSATLITHDTKAYEAVAQSLEKQLGLITNYRGFNLDIQKDESESQFTGFLQVEGVQKIPCTIALDNEFRVIFTLQPTLAELDALATFVCSQSAELQELESYCSIKSLEIDRENSLLRGNVIFSSINHPAIPWSINPAGDFDMVTPLKLLTDVAAFKKDKKAKRKHRLTEQQLLNEVKKHVANSRFEKHIEVGNVNCNDLANAFTLGIRIGDWPSVRLEPLEVNSLDEVKKAIDESLSAISLSRQINEYWGSVFSHPRFGRSVAKLVDWSPSVDQATIETTMLLADGAIPISVLERVTFREDDCVYQIFNVDTKNWIPSNAITIGRYLEHKTQLESLFEAVGGYASGLTGIKVSVELDDDIDSHWFRLSPPSMMFRAKLGIPMLNGAELGFGKMEVSQNGVEVPNAVIFQPKFSVPCPHFTASDPRIEVDFDEKHLKLGVKVTPLFPGVKVRNTAALATYRVSGLPLSDVRWDNLFLHAGHVYVQIDGKIDTVGEESKSRFTMGAQGNIIALEDMKLAQCRGEVAILGWELDRLSLALDASTEPVGFDFGRLEGNFMLIPRRELMRLDGSLDLNGLFLAGKLDYQSLRSGEKKMISIGDKHFSGGIKVDARSEIPVIGTATISGASDLSFQDYCLKATNSIPVPFSEGYWRYDLTVTQLQTKIKWTWITPSGKTMTYTTESPRVDLIDTEKLTAELQSAYEISNEVDLRDASPSESSGRANDSRNGRNAKQYSSTVEPIKKLDDYDKPDVSVYVDGDDLKAVYDAGARQEIGRISAKKAGVGNWNQLEQWTGWTPSDGYAVFCIQEESDSNEGKVFTVLFQPDGTVRCPAIELLASELEFAKTSGALRSRANNPKGLMARAVLLDSIEFRLHGYGEVEISEIEHGFVVTAKNGKYKTICKSYTVLPGQTAVNRYSYVDLDSAIRKKAIAELSRGIDGIQGKLIDESYVVAANFETRKPKSAVIRRLSRDRFILKIQQDGGISTHQIERVDGVSAYDVFHLAKKFAESVWSEGVVPVELIYVGDAGACVALDDGWLLLPSEAFADPRLKSFVHLSKRDFNKGWAVFGGKFESSESLLPATLRSRQSRSGSNATILAKTCVMSWDELKKETDREQRWFAHPMGLLIELALLNKDKKLTE